jgi:hypothetical protein
MREHCPTTLRYLQARGCSHDTVRDGSGKVWQFRA